MTDHLATLDVPPGPRFDLSSLERLLGTASSTTDEGTPNPDGALSIVLGLSRDSICKARVRGLNEVQADAYAVRAGFVPSQVWEGWGVDTPDPVCEWCGRTEMPAANHDRCNFGGLPCRRYDRRRTACWWRRLDRWRPSEVAA